MQGPRGDRAAVEIEVTHAFAAYSHSPPGGGAAIEKQELPAWLREGLTAGLSAESTGSGRSAEHTGSGR